MAENAAAVVSPDLDGATALDPVNVAADRGRPARRSGGAIHLPGIERHAGSSGLVSFYVGCGERAYFGSVLDISQSGPTAPSTFPALSESDAAAELGVSTPQLVYTSSPFTPEWRDEQSGAIVLAGE